MSSIVKLEGVSKKFPGGLVAVDGASLVVEEGEFVTLLGPSGCGKSTILRMIAGFESPDSGAIFLGDSDVTELPPYRRAVNMVFQDYALFPHMTVRKNVGYGLKVSGVDMNDIGPRVDEALTLVELTEKADNMPSQLSGGQRQRVSLARALVRKPRVLLLDEPLSALDANLREAMQVELRHLHQKLGITFIMVTHDQTEALAMADRIVVMEKGRIAQIGSPTDLYDRPATPYVARFIGSSSFLKATVVEVGESLVTARVGKSQISLFPPENSLKPGSQVDLCIRPEKLRISTGTREREAAVSSLTGTISNTVYQGATVRLEVTLEDGQLLMVDVPLETATTHSTVPPPGTSVDIVVRPADVLVYPSSDASITVAA